MDDAPPNYHKEFAKSPHHVWLGLGTLGLGFLSAHLLGLILGVTGYALAWIYLPDFPWFRQWVDRRRDAVTKAAALEELSGFLRRRETLLEQLSINRRNRYLQLAQVCRDIEASTEGRALGEGDAANDPMLRKLDELMWTYLRLLAIEETSERFVTNESQENLPGLLEDAEAQAKQVSGELEALRAKGGPSLEARQRLLGSVQDRVQVLIKRLQRLQQSRENLDLVHSEQVRLEQQIKLIRADAVAAKNTDGLTARIDATVEHLGQTTKWLAELDEFKDLVGDLPQTDRRVGFESGADAQQVTPPAIATDQPAGNNSRRTRVRTY